MKINENQLIAMEVAIAAGKVIFDIYKSWNFVIETTEDEILSNITDKSANEVINGFFVSTYIPIVSKKNEEKNYIEREKCQNCWIGYALAGTKKIIRRINDFTVIIRLVSAGKPLLGVIEAPALHTNHFADIIDKRAYKFSSLKNLLNGQFLVFYER